MNIALNGFIHYTAAFHFNNGWSMVISVLNCGHNKVIIVPTWFIELDDGGRDGVIMSQERMEAEGDYYPHITDDNQLVSIIAEVAQRYDAPIYGKVTTMLDDVLRKRN